MLYYITVRYCNGNVCRVVGFRGKATQSVRSVAGNTTTDYTGITVYSHFSNTR